MKNTNLITQNRAEFGNYWPLQGTIDMTQKAEYITKMKSQLDKLNAKMEHLQTTAQEAKEDARLKFKEEMTKLRHQSKTATAKLEEMKQTSEDSWKTLVTDMEQMHDAFTHSFFSLFQTPSVNEQHPTGEKSSQETKKS